MARFILERYYFKELIKNFFGVFFTLVIILAVIQLSNTLEDIGSNIYPADQIPYLIYFLLLNQFPVLLPLCLVFAMIFTQGKFSRDSEIFPLLFAGFGMGKILKINLFSALIFALLIGWVSMVLAPEANRDIELLRSEQARQGLCCNIPSGEFLQLDGVNGVLYADQSNAGLATNVFLYIEDEEFISYSFSESASWRPESDLSGSVFIMNNGLRFEGNEGESELTITEFEEQGVYFPYEENIQPELPPEAMSISNLMSGEREYLAEIYQRLSSPVIVILLSLFPLLFLDTRPRSGKYVSTIPILIIFMSYINLTMYFKNLYLSSELNALILISPHIAMVALAYLIYFFKKAI